MEVLLDRTVVFLPPDSPTRNLWLAQSKGKIPPGFAEDCRVWIGFEIRGAVEKPAAAMIQSGRKQPDNIIDYTYTYQKPFTVLTTPL